MAAARHKEPLRAHLEAYRARGYSPRIAEELVAREHELRALTASGASPWRWAGRALCIYDAALIEAERELAATPAASRTPAQAHEWRRVQWLRGCLTGPRPRTAFVLAPMLGVAALAGAAWRRATRRDGDA